MKAQFCSVFLTLLGFQAIGQVVYEPQILILAPGNVQFDKSFGKEIAGLDAEAKGRQHKMSSAEQVELRKQPANIQKMMASEQAFSQHMSFVNQASFISEQFLTYKFIENFPNLLILLKDSQSNGEIADLRRIAEGSGLEYVLNFPRLSFYREGGIGYARLAVQLYDQSSNSMLIDTTFVGNWFNPGFEFACHDSSLSCTVGNSLSQALDRVLYQVAKNSPKLKRERQLWQARLDVLRNDFYSRSFDRSIVVDVIPARDSGIVMGSMYQLLVSHDRQKFVAFFLEKKDAKGFKGLAENKGDKNVQVLSDKNIKDSGYLEDIPQTYAYIVKAVQYKGKWYYEKSNVTYFQPKDGEGGRLQYFNSLQDWGFFQDSSTMISEGFWETHLFERVKDLRKDPDWDKYGTTMWKRDEEENRPYIGMYQVVADQLKGAGQVQVKRITIN